MTGHKSSEQVLQAAEAAASTLCAEAEKESRRNTMWNWLKLGMVLLVLALIGSCWTKVIG
jgi:hypothetical protein